MEYFSGARTSVVRAVRKVLHKRGFELVRSPTLQDFLETRRVDLVLDVGANVGDFAVQIRRAGYAGRIISFEPVAATFAELQFQAASDPKWSVVKSAVGAASGSIEMNVAKNSVFSSARALTALAYDFDQDAATVATESVDLTTLEAVCQGEQAKSIFLKVDTQGFEQDVLAGAASVLDRFSGIQLELPIEHLYEGVWSFREALAFMDEAGFTPAQIRPVNPMQDDRASAIEFDCVFRRR